MYAVKENRQVIIERMMDLGCDPLQVNKVKEPSQSVPSADHLSQSGQGG